MGRLKERYPRVARYYRMEYAEQQKRFSWQEDLDKKAIAEKLDGGYVLLGGHLKPAIKGHFKTGH